MALPDAVHAFQFDMDFGDRTMRLHPSAIETAGGVLLIDTGIPPEADNVLGQLEEAGFSAEDIAMVLLTHQDGDHAGGLFRVLEEANPTVIAHEIAAPVIDGRQEPRTTPAEGERYPPARVDIEVSGETTINTDAGPARVVETPGHTPGHVSIYLPDEKLLIAGDALGLYDDRLDKPEPAVTMDQDDAIASIDKLSGLDIDEILCYHGGLTDQGTSRLEEIAAEGY